MSELSAPIAELDLLERRLRAAPADHQALSELLSAAADSGRLDLAARYLIAATRAAPHDPIPLHLLGLCCQALGDLESAEQTFAAALSLGPNLAAAHAALADLLAQRGQRDAAIGHRRHAAALAGEAAPAPAPPPARAREPNTIVIVSDSPGTREAKLGQAIRLAGWRAALWHRDDPNFSVQDHFDATARYGTAWQALELARASTAGLFHIVARMNYDTAGAFIAHRPGPVVLDPYDVLNGVLQDGYLASSPELAMALRLERFCLAEADALLCRCPETSVARRRGLRLSRRRALFPEFAWGDQPRGAKLGAADGALHVVCGGTVSLDVAGSPNEFCYLWLADLLSRHGHHFHIYPTNVSADRFEEYFAPYFDLARQRAFVHVHRPLPWRDWLAEVACYDVMASLPLNHLQGQPLRNYTTDKIRAAYTNKLADCVDGDLLYLGAADMWSVRIARRLGFGVAANWSELNDPAFWQALARRVRSSPLDHGALRARYRLAAQAERLTSFYEQILAADVGALS